MCDVSLLPIPSSIPSILAALTPFNNIDEDSQNISQLRAFHDLSFNTVTTNQSIKPLCPEKQIIKPKYSFSEENGLTHSEVEPKALSPPNMSLVMETVSIRAYSVRHNTVIDIIRSGTPRYGTVPYNTVSDANHLELIYPSTV